MCVTSIDPLLITSGSAAPSPKHATAGTAELYRETDCNSRSTSPSTASCLRWKPVVGRHLRDTDSLTTPVLELPLIGRSEPGFADTHGLCPEAPTTPQTEQKEVFKSMPSTAQPSFEAILTGFAGEACEILNEVSSTGKQQRQKLEELADVFSAVESIHTHDKQSMAPLLPVVAGTCTSSLTSPSSPGATLDQVRSITRLFEDMGSTSGSPRSPLSEAASDYTAPLPGAKTAMNILGPTLPRHTNSTFGFPRKSQRFRRGHGLKPGEAAATQALGTSVLPVCGRSIDKFIRR